MNSSAKVTSLDAMRTFYSAILKFAEEAELALAMMRTESLRSIDWIENDRPSYWKRQIQKSYDLVAHRRQELQHCKMRTFGDFRPSCIEEKKALENAKRRLQFCQATYDQIPQWASKIRHESEEHRGRMGQIGHILAAEVPQMLGLLKNMIQALEDYAEVGNRELDITTDDSPTDGSPGAEAK